MKELAYNMNAQDWAQEFMKCKEKNQWSLEDIDEGLMISWFANAIMAGFDVATERNENSNS